MRHDNCICSTRNVGLIYSLIKITRTRLQASDREVVMHKIASRGCPCTYKIENIKHSIGLFLCVENRNNGPFYVKAEDVQENVYFVYFA